MTGSNECKFTLCTTELTRNIPQPGSNTEGLFAALQTSAKDSALDVYLGF